MNLTTIEITKGRLIYDVIYHLWSWHYRRHRAYGLRCRMSWTRTWWSGVRVPFEWASTHLGCWNDTRSTTSNSGGRNRKHTLHHQGRVRLTIVQSNQRKTEIILGIGLSQWKTTLHRNVVCHWLSPYPEWSGKVQTLLFSLIADAIHFLMALKNGNFIPKVNFFNMSFTFSVKVHWNGCQ